MVYFDQIVHKYARQHCLTTGMCDSLFRFLEALLSVSLAGRGQLVKMLITLELHGIFVSKFCKLNLF